MLTAVVFPGQGSQTVGMGADLANMPVSVLFERANSVLGYSLSEIMLNGPEETLRLTENAQPALLTHSFALWSLIRDKVNPSFFAGHSLGEYTALAAAGCITFEDAVKMVHNRGRFMQDAVPVGVGGMMAVIGATDTEVETVCQEVSAPGAVVEPANYNADGQIVVAGHNAALASFAAVMKERYAKRSISLPVSAPFHCSLMEPAQNRMANYISGVEFLPPLTPVVNNIDARIENEVTRIKGALVRQITGAVRWTQAVRTLISLGVTTFIEVGAGAVLSGLIKKIDRNISCVNISMFEDITKVNG